MAAPRTLGGRVSHGATVALDRGLENSPDERSPPSDEWLPQAEETSAGSEAAAKQERMKERTPRVDGAGLLKRTFDFDVFACGRCAGRRRVLAYLTAPGGVRAILEHLGLPTLPGRLAPARGPPHNSWC